MTYSLPVEFISRFVNDFIVNVDTHSPTCFPRGLITLAYVSVHHCRSYFRPTQHYRALDFLPLPVPPNESLLTPLTCSTPPTSSTVALRPLEFMCTLLLFIFFLLHLFAIMLYCSYYPTPRCECLCTYQYHPIVHLSSD